MLDSCTHNRYDYKLVYLGLISWNHRQLVKFWARYAHYPLCTAWLSISSKRQGRSAHSWMKSQLLTMTFDVGHINAEMQVMLPASTSHCSAERTMDAYAAHKCDCINDCTVLLLYRD